MPDTFDILRLNSKLIEGLKKEGINEPTDIQAKTIPFILESMDVLGESQTGSGKTLAYLLPLFQRIDTSKREMQVMILAPTHELVMQIESVVKTLSKDSEVPVTSMPIIGEVNIKKQIEKLKEKPHILVGSPGRIFELIKLKKISAHTIKTIVIDECDRLMDENNLPKIKDVIKTTLRDRQLLAFSATINERTLSIAKEIMKSPEIVRIEEKFIVNPDIKHIYIVAEKRDKIEVVRKLAASIKPEQAIVFMNRSEEIELLTLKLRYHHIDAYSIFGSASKEDRKKAMEGFRDGRIQLLIASDLAARGLDIKGVSFIINLDLPEDPKEYLHRAGRTGRAGESGVSVSVITENELSKIGRYEKYLNINILEKEIRRGVIVDPSHNRVSSKNR